MPAATSGEFNSSTDFFPGVDPYITQVGGTGLTTTGPGGAWSAETAWSQSGGGYLSGTPIPAWQQLTGSDQFVESRLENLAQLS